MTVFFPVLNNDYYKVTGTTGSPSIVKWYEWTIDTLVVTRSVDLTSRVLQSASVPTRAYLNNSGKSIFVSYSGHNATTGAAIASAAPTIGYAATTIPQTAVAIVSATGSATGYRTVQVVVNPLEFYIAYMDSGTIVNDAYFEWTLE